MRYQGYGVNIRFLDKKNIPYRECFFDYKQMKNILAISGSTRKESSNHKLIHFFTESVKDKYNVTLFEGIDTLPHFNPDLDSDNPPQKVTDFRKAVSNADAILFCTPEYVFSIPGSLKNAIEWCVSTTVFSQKPIGIITASASGAKGHEELKMIMHTLEAKFTDEATLLISGIRGKINNEGSITDIPTSDRFEAFVKVFVNS
jgi:chromate reductase